MSVGSATFDDEKLYFVPFDPASLRCSNRSKKLAKAHVARINWHRQKAKIRAKQSGGSTYGRSVHQLVADTTSAGGQTACDGGEETTDQIAIRIWLGGNKSNISAAVATRASEARLEPPSENWEHRWHRGESLFPVSPVVGALKINSFNTQGSSTQLETAHYYVDVIIASGGMLEHELSARFADICEHPVIFNAIVYAVGMHQSMRDLPVAASNYTRTLAHQNIAIRMVNEMIDNLDSSNLDHLLFAIMQLWRHNPEPPDSKSTQPFLFSPHLRDANWARLYSRMSNDEVHARALFWLLNRIGGTSAIKMPGLAKELHIIDVTRSSAACNKPQFLSMWDKDYYLSQIPALICPPLATQHTLGKGFWQHVPGGLPSQALEALQHIALVDHILAKTKNSSLSDLDFYNIVGLRNGAQHQLLNLPPWSDLPEADKMCFQATSETCRITAIIYSNSVLMGLLPSPNWLQHLLQQLKQVLDMANMSSWWLDTKNLLTWVLFVASMAAYETEHRAYFVSALRRHLWMHELHTWANVQAILQDFIWSESACGQGATVIWASPDLADVAEGVEIPC